MIGRSRQLMECIVNQKKPKEKTFRFLKQHDKV